MPEGEPLVSVNGVAKLDLSAETEDEALAGRIAFPPGFQGGDTVFIADDKGKSGETPHAAMIDPSLGRD